MYSKIKPRYIFEVKPERSKHRFALYIKWIKTSFRTRESDFYKRGFQINIKGNLDS